MRLLKVSLTDYSYLFQARPPKLLFQLFFFTKWIHGFASL